MLTAYCSLSSRLPLIVNAFLQGLGLGFSLIIAIGAQNAFVLRQGLRRQHRLITALICFGCDAILIALGVAGFGNMIEKSPLLLILAKWGGALFLFYYGLRSFRSVLTMQRLQTNDTELTRVTLKSSVAAALGFSLLNPHVYLDTVVLLGSVGTQIPASTRHYYALGAMTASMIWFLSLAFGSSLLAPLFQRPIAWKILDVIIGGIMWSLAFSLIRE
jgi:L-lysine exporter family protein LysE/ArgO